MSGIVCQQGQKGQLGTPISVAKGMDRVQFGSEPRKRDRKPALREGLEGSWPP